MREQDIENIINFEKMGDPLTHELNDLRSINVIRRVTKTLFDKFKEEMRKAYIAGSFNEHDGSANVEVQLSIDFNEWFEKQFESNND